MLKMLVCIPFLVCSCTGKPAKIAESSKITERPTVSYAKRFKIENIHGYSQLSVINPWQGASDVIQKWELVPRGVRLSSLKDTSAVIRVPVKKIICMSTTHLAMISALNETGSVAGFSGTKFLFEQDFIRLVDEGKILK